MPWHTASTSGKTPGAVGQRLVSMALTTVGALTLALVFPVLFIV